MKIISKFVVLVLSLVLSYVASSAGENLPAGVSEDWWSKIRANISGEEYRVSPGAPEKGALFSAANRAQGFRSYFTEKGVRLVPRTEEKPSWEWGLEFVWRAEDSSRKAEMTVQENRIEINRGDITEWYVNDEKGLEQGFTISKRESAGAINESPGTLNIDMRLTGNLHPRFAEDGQSVDLYGRGNIAVLTYSGLKAFDSAGTVLPSRFEAISGGIRIIVDDSAAVYPITIDPLVTSPSCTLQGDQAGSSFGWSVSTAGDVNGDGYSDVFVSAPLWTQSISNNGMVYLYLGSPSGPGTTPVWSRMGGTDSFLGSAVASAGDINGDGYSDWLFSASGSPPEVVLVEYGDQACNFSEDSLIEDNGEGLGTDLSSAGDVNGDGYSDIIVSEPYYGNSRGKVFLYLGSKSGIVKPAAWSALGENDGDYFGMSCSFAGDVNGDGYSDVVIGAKNYGGNTGKAYLYLGSSSGLSSTASWTATGSSSGDLLGASVITAGDTDGDGYSDVLVGAPGFSSSTGRAYLYKGGASGLAASPSWTATGEASSNYFSEALGPAGDINGDGYADVIAGARGYGSNAGKAYLYLGSAAGLSATSSWTYTGAATGYQAGCSVMTAGDVNGDGYSDVVVGAKGADRAYLFTGSSGGPASTANWAVSGETTSNYYGYSLASAGDVNGDGYTDVVVGAFNNNSGAGKAYLYMGSASGLYSFASWTAVGESAGDYFGYSVASAGDVNGDGYSDVVIGASNCSSNTGKAYLYLGGSTGLSSPPAWTATGESAGSYFGNCVASAGDVNGDGFSDVVVGANGYSSNTGKGYLYLGGISGLATSCAWSKTGETVGDNFSYSITTAGDVNGDGYSDVVAGAYKYNSEAGKAYLYLGSPSGLSSTASWSRAGEDVSYRFGMCVATAGDVNGDGYSDVVIGANYFNSRMGKAYVFNGSPSGLSFSYSWTVNGEVTNIGYGYSLASAGDVNGDGYSDLIVGARGFSGGGKTYLYLGSASGLATTEAWTALGEASSSYFGGCVASAGDVNGDGYSDVIVGAPNYVTSTGRSYLFMGNGGTGKTVRLRQLRNDLSAPVAPGCNAYEQAFRAKMLLKSPFGRVFTKLEWQAAPLLGSLNLQFNPPLSSARWWDSGLSGVTLTEAVDISEMEGPWIWRARARYNPAQSPFQWWGPWVSHSANGLRETDLRSVAYSAPPSCVPPDEPCWIYLVTTDGTNHTINFQDPNQQDQRTGWNVRRSSDASVTPKSSWPLVCSNCVDMDASAANYQWTDSSGDTPPSGVWYYLVTAYNENCPAEGPFQGN